MRLDPLIFIIPSIFSQESTPEIDTEDDINNEIISSRKNLDPVSACDDSSCFPAVGDLLIGREQNISASSTCGLEQRERYCIVSHLKDAKKCYFCDDSNPAENHSIQQAVTSNLGRRLSTWWQSVNAPEEEVVITLDLEAQFHFTHLIMTFKTFRPAAMVIERSNDYGATWQPYRYFADDCESRFPEIKRLESVQLRMDEVICDEKYSKIEPSTMGEVIYKALDPSALLPKDSYSKRVQNWILITNLRIRMTSFHTLGDDVLEPTKKTGKSDVNQKYYYALYELIIRGNCFCYGHAEVCAPVDDSYDLSSVSEHMVHGQCKCMHETAGKNCEKCKPMYNDRPWKPAFIKQPNECQRCECNGHADTCHFSEERWQETGETSGGVCDNCRHNTMGINCEQCSDGYFQDPNYDINHPSACQPCQCNPEGTVTGNVCVKKTNENGDVAGFCQCKQHVTGKYCDRCKPGYYNLDPNNPDGCTPCDCDFRGTSDLERPCDEYTGDCYCKLNVEGKQCDTCIDSYWGLSQEDNHGCTACGCVFGSSTSDTCDKTTGQCDCRPNIEGMTCDKIVERHFVPDLDYYTVEAETVESEENEVEEQEIFEEESSGQAPDEPKKSNKLPTFTGDGYLVVDSNSTLKFRPIVVQKDSNYCVAIRYKPDEQVIDPYNQDSVYTTNIPVTVHFSADDSDLDDTNIDPSSPCYNKSPSDNEMNFELPNDSKHFVGCDQQICLIKDREYTATLHFDGQTKVDSLVVVPVPENLEAQPEPPKAPEGEYEPDDMFKDLDLYGTSLETTQPIPLPETTTYTNAVDLTSDCLNQVLALPKNITDSCRRKIFGVTADHYNGAQSCNCDPTGSHSANCSPQGGQCSCRENIIGRQCQKCAPFTYGFSTDGCKECACHPEGTTSNDLMCDRETGQCNCISEGVTGRQCDRCKIGYYNFPNCVRCECHGHSNYCDPETGECIDCADNTVGKNCESCQTHFYGDPTQPDFPCTKCRCPGEFGKNQYFASHCTGMNFYDEATAVSTYSHKCSCIDGHIGDRCDQCAPGYYGNPKDPNGRGCKMCECNNNIDMNDPEACDSVTGECKNCLYNTKGRHCEECEWGFYPRVDQNGNRVGGCVACTCDPDGTDPNKCDENGICQCNMDGSCDCHDSVEGRNCDQCKPQYYAKGGIGCKHCNCDRDNSIDRNCTEVTGQCECKEGFGGRDCSGCKDGYFGDPTIQNCEICGCDPSTSNYIEKDGQVIFTCHSETGQCDCFEGIGGRKCDQCAYGYFQIESYYSDPEEPNECQRCDQCFHNWNNIIQDVKLSSERLLATADNLARTGITGQYTDSFQQLDNVLFVISQTLDSSVQPEVEHKLNQFETLRGALSQQRTKVLTHAHLIQEVLKEDNSIQTDLAKFKLRLKEVVMRIKKMEDLVESCRRSTPQQSLSEMADALKNSNDALFSSQTYTNISDPSSPISRADILREQAQIKADQNVDEFIEENEKFQQTLDQTIDEANDISISDLNAMICGAATEGCDDICGGAGCEHCGGLNPMVSSCEGAATLAKQASSTAEKAKNSLEEKLKKSDSMLVKVTSASENVLKTQEEVDQTLKNADRLNKKIGSNNEKIHRLIEKIKKFLEEHKDGPDSILEIADEVISMTLPEDGDVTGVIKKLQALVDKIDTYDEKRKIFVERAEKTHKLYNRASKAESDARLELESTSKAEKNIHNAEQINTKVAKKLQELDSGANDWKEKLELLDSGVSTIHTELSDLQNKITKVYSSVEKTMGHNSQITNEAQAIHDSTLSSKEATEEAFEFLQQGQKDQEIGSLAKLGKEKAEKWIDASKRAQNVRKRSEELRQKVENHMNTLTTLERDFYKNQNLLKEKRQELNGMLTEAEDIRRTLTDKLKEFTTKCGTA